jgi:hypothetical protein
LILFWSIYSSFTNSADCLHCRLFNKFMGIIVSVQKSVAYWEHCADGPFSIFFPNQQIIFLYGFLLDNDFEAFLLPIVRLLQLQQIHSNPRNGFNCLIFNEICLLLAQIRCREPLSSFESSGFLMISHSWNVRNGNCEMRETVEGLKWKKKVGGTDESLISGRSERISK